MQKNFFFFTVTSSVLQEGTHVKKSNKMMLSAHTSPGMIHIQTQRDQGKVAMTFKEKYI